MRARNGLFIKKKGVSCLGVAKVGTYKNQKSGISSELAFSTTPW